MTVATVLLLTTQLSSSIGRAAPRIAQPDNIALEQSANLLSTTANADLADITSDVASASLTALRLAKPFVYQGAVSDRDRAIDCLATAAWYEAGNDPSGQRAVIQVVLNRLRHPSFPKTVCGVVFQGSERKTGCQFSFTCDGSMARRLPSTSNWVRARTLSENAVNGAVDTAVGQATHFHADYVAPWWGPKLEQISKIGSHIFYGWHGTQGALSSANWLIAREALPEQLPAGTRPSNPELDTGMSTQLALDTGDDFAHGIPSIANLKVMELTRATLIQVDANGPSGRWALSAMEKCSARVSCQIVGYGQPEQIDHNRALPGSAMDRPLFLFIRDKASGMDLALWDCERVERNNSAQCLPGNGPELNNLMQNR
jgi:spore germination cell wall hydrolase CwlJ-like protein